VQKTGLEGVRPNPSRVLRSGVAPSMDMDLPSDELVAQVAHFDRLTTRAGITWQEQ